MMKIEKETINRIEKRAIEASAILPLIKELSKRIGRDEASALLLEVNKQEAYQRGRDRQAADGKNGLDELIKDVATWGEGGVWEMEILEQTSTTYFFNVSRCPYYEKYRELGVEATNT